MANLRLMQQKVNVSDPILAYWKRTMEYNLRSLIHKHLLSMNDYATEFEHQDRKFMIFGMTESEHVILKETIDGKHYYWECTAEFVQMKLNRFYTEWKIINGIRVPFNAVYENRKLHLPINRIQRKKKEEPEEIEEPLMESYTEEYHDESE